MDTGWRCPRCELVLSPSVREHRCDPPTAAVPATGAPAPPNPFPASISITAPGYETTTYSATGNLITVACNIAIPADDIRRGLERQQANWRTGRAALPLAMATAGKPYGHGKPKCGAKKHQGEGACARPAGWGTDHPGVGRCKFHGGCTVSQRAAATEQLALEAVKTYGLPRDISPTDALLEEVRYTAGHVAWLREQVQALEAGDLVWGITEEAEKNATEFPGTDVTRGAKANIWLELYYRERKHLVDVTKAAISAGIEERKVRIAEHQGALVAAVIKGILADLALSAEQQAKVPDIVPRHLRALAG